VPNITSQEIKLFKLLKMLLEYDCVEIYTKGTLSIIRQLFEYGFDGSK
jgi:hypothetical protein